MATRTLKPSGGDFSTLASALSDAGTVANDIIEISGDWTSTTDTTAATVADDNITIRTKAGDVSRHLGVKIASNYELAVGGANCLTINNTGCVLDGPIIKQTSGVSNEGIRYSIASGTLTIKNCIIWAGSKVDQQDGIFMNSDLSTITLENTAIFGFDRGGLTLQPAGNDGDLTAKIVSCCFTDNGHNNSATFGGGGIVVHNGGTGNVHVVDVHNTWSLGNTTAANSDDYLDAPGGGDGGGATTWGISYSADSDGSIASIDGTGAGNLASRVLSESDTGGNDIIVVDKATLPYDLTLVDDATNNNAQDAHAVATAEGLTIPSTDVAGTTTPQNTNHDIGFFEVVANKNTESGGMRGHLGGHLSGVV